MVNGPLSCSGLLMVECKLGWMVSDSTPMLLTCDPLLAAEVQGLLVRSTWGGGDRPGWYCSSETSEHGVGLTREDLSGATYMWCVCCM